MPPQQNAGVFDCPCNHEPQMCDRCRMATFEQLRGVAAARGERSRSWAQKARLEQGVIAMRDVAGRDDQLAKMLGEVWLTWARG